MTREIQDVRMRTVICLLVLEVYQQFECDVRLPKKRTLAHACRRLLAFIVVPHDNPAPFFDVAPVLPPAQQRHPVEQLAYVVVVKALVDMLEMLAEVFPASDQYNSSPSFPAG